MADTDEIKQEEGAEDGADTTEETLDNGGADAVVVEEEAVIEEPVHTVAPSPVMAPVEAIVAPVVQAAAPVQATMPGVNPDGSITLTAEAFAGLMGRLGKLEDDSKLLTQVQDRNTIQKIERLRAEGKLVKSVKVRKIGEKYVVGWQTLQDEVYQNEDGRLVEKQTVKIFFHDNSDKVFTMRQWASVGEYVPFEVTGETKDAEGNLFFKAIGTDGLALTINASFIN